MTELRWTRDSTFHDGQRNFRARGPGVYDVPEDAVEKYLEHRSGAWERVDDGGGEESDDDQEDEQDGEPEKESAAEISEDELAEVLDGTIGEVEEALATGDYDDVLDRLEALEEDGEDRKGVYSAIDDRREE